MKDALRLDNISKSFDESNQILEPISMEFHTGEITCILGPSGCGKTTILRMISGLEIPNTGKIISSFDRPGKAVGYMRQGERLIPWRTVLQNVLLKTDLIAKTIEDDLREAKELLCKLGLKEFMDYYPNQLSGGMTQRVLLARTLFKYPKLLLLDEPLSQLDIVGKENISGIIKTIITQTSSIGIIVTHSIEEAIFLADRVIILNSQKPTKVKSIIHMADIKEQNPYQQIFNTLRREE